jgi:hypothetical protein
MHPIPSRADGVSGTVRRRTIHRCRKDGDHEHNRCFHQFGCPRADAWDNPQRADSPEDEARPKHESKIEHASFKSLHDTSLGALGTFLMRFERSGEAYH